MYKVYPIICAKGFDGEKTIIPVMAYSIYHARDIFESTYGINGWVLISVE